MQNVLHDLRSFFVSFRKLFWMVFYYFRKFFVSYTDVSQIPGHRFALTSIGPLALPVTIALKLVSFSGDRLAPITGQSSLAGQSSQQQLQLQLQLQLQMQLLLQLQQPITVLRLVIGYRLAMITGALLATRTTGQDC